MFFFVSISVNCSYFYYFNLDCGNLTIQNGTFITSNGTTYGQIGKHVCDAGFILIGEQNIRCTVNGWSDISTYCKIVGMNLVTSILISVYNSMFSRQLNIGLCFSKLMDASAN